MNSEGLGGIAAAEGFVIAGCRDAADQRDEFYLLDAETGLPLGIVNYPAPGRLDYGNSPRATPLITGGRAYLFGAFGHLTCVDLETCEIAWQRNLAQEYHTPPMSWGLVGSPLLSEGKLIVQPGGLVANLAALDPISGETLWTSEGNKAGHSSCILATVSGQRQIIGYDARSLGGWDAGTGKRLWSVTPEVSGDFNVPTPSLVGELVFVATENNGSRLYRLEGSGGMKPLPLARNDDLSPDSHSPIVMNGRIYGVWDGLHCLDAHDGLKEVWLNEDEAFSGYASLIGSGNRLLALSEKGELILLEDQGSTWRESGRLRLAPRAADALSHPALSGGALYVRVGRQLSRLNLE